MQCLVSIINPPQPVSIVLNRFWFLTKDLVRVLNSNVKPRSSLEFQIQDLTLLRTIENGCGGRASVLTFNERHPNRFLSYM